jgi:protein-tyrosine phosphatase
MNDENMMLAENNSATAADSTPICDHLALARIKLLQSYLREPTQIGSAKTFATQMTPVGHPFTQTKQLHQGKGVCNPDDIQSLKFLLEYLFEHQIDVIITCSTVHYVSTKKQTIVDRLGQSAEERASAFHHTVWDCFAPDFDNNEHRSNLSECQYDIAGFESTWHGRLEYRRFRLTYLDQSQQVLTKKITQVVIHDWEDGTTYEFTEKECRLLFNLLHNPNTQHYYIHCLGGIGRSGSIIRAYLTHVLLPLNANELTAFFTNEAQCLTQARQRRRIITAKTQFTFALNLAIQFRLYELSVEEQILFHTELKSANERFSEPTLVPFSEQNTSDNIENVKQYPQAYWDAYVLAVAAACTQQTMTLEQWPVILNTIAALHQQRLSVQVAVYYCQWHSTHNITHEFAKICAQLNVAALTILAKWLLSKRRPHSCAALLFSAFAERTGVLAQSCDSSIELCYTTIIYASCTYLLDPQNYQHMLNRVMRCWHNINDCNERFSISVSLHKLPAYKFLKKLIADYFNDDVIIHFDSESDFIERLGYLTTNEQVSAQKYIALARLVVIFYQYEADVPNHHYFLHQYCCNATQALVLACHDVHRISGQGFTEIFALLKKLFELTSKSKYLPDQAVVRCCERLIHARHDLFLIEQSAISKSKLSKCLSRLSLRHRSFPPVMSLTHIVYRLQSP